MANVNMWMSMEQVNWLALKLDGVVVNQHHIAARGLVVTCSPKNWWWLLRKRWRHSKNMRVPRAQLHRTLKHSVRSLQNNIRPE